MCCENSIKRAHTRLKLKSFDKIKLLFFMVYDLLIHCLTHDKFFFTDFIVVASMSVYIFLSYMTVFGPRVLWAMFIVSHIYTK